MSSPKWGSNNPNLNRDEIKLIRDRVKSKYNKGTKCEICDSEEKLEFHHYYSMTALWDKWKKENNITIHDKDEMLEEGGKFIENHIQYIYNETVTLCHFHHAERLHKIYGKSPALFTAKKQKRWVGIQRKKFLEGK